jgi:anti-sigma regulatory factor (Ser/Thr protein kinase)
VAVSDITLAPARESAGEARRFVRDRLTAAGSQDLVETAELLTSELVTNTVLHARTPARLVVEVNDVVRVEVHDRDRQLAEPRDRGAESATGRGLVLVDALAQAWGNEVTADGKVVWFELDRPAA